MGGTIPAPKPAEIISSLKMDRHELVSALTALTYSHPGTAKFNSAKTDAIDVLRKMNQPPDYVRPSRPWPRSEEEEDLMFDKPTWWFEKLLERFRGK